MGIGDIMSKAFRHDWEKLKRNLDILEQNAKINGIIFYTEYVWDIFYDWHKAESARKRRWEKKKK